MAAQVRSVPLRGLAFDRDSVNKVQRMMSLTGTCLEYGCNPTAVRKLPSGRLEVTLDSKDGSKVEVFDTVLVATGHALG